MYKVIATILLGAVISVSHAQTAPSSSPQNASTPQNASDVEANASSPQMASAPANPHDPNAPTLAQLQAPAESELSVANTKLLAKNAELESRVAELTTQVNVLVNERHGQFFLYGALTALFCFGLGVVLSWTVFNKKKSNW